MDLQSSMNLGVTNFIIAITSLVTAIGVIWVNVIAARAKAKVVDTADKMVKKADEIGETTKITLGHVNSAATEMRAVIEALRQENNLLRIHASENREIAAVLAASAARSSDPARSALTRSTDATKVEVVNTPAAPVPIIAAAPDEAP